MEKKHYIHLIKAAFKEDLNRKGDITSDSIFNKEKGEFVLFSKDRGTLAGMELFKESFLESDKTIIIEEFYHDSDTLEPGNKVALVNGKIAAILSAERIALNFVSTLSGIATRAREFVLAARAGGKAVILDTRKTLPAYRYISKYAVMIGQGQNHRMGLYDMIMIKDNHIDAAGGITNAVNLVRKRWDNKFQIEVECRNLKDVAEAMSCNVDRIMLDNMELAQIRDAVAFVKGKIKLEASGNMTLERIQAVSSTGVDFISVGCITKSINAFDFSLKKG